MYNEGKISDLSASGSLTEATLPASLASIISIKSGNWNDPTVWTSGTVPTATDNVVIGCTGNHTVTITSAVTTAFTNNTPVSIPDNTPSGGVAAGNTIPTAASLTGCATCAFSQITVPAGTYTGIHSLNFSITHNWLQDLDIYLLAPDGTVFLVSTDNGSISSNYTNTTIQDGNALIYTGTAPFTGTYSLEVGTLASYAGTYTGNWRLYAIDDEAIISGTITNFSLNLTLPATTGAVCNNLTINNSSTIQYADNNTLTVNGNLMNNGTLNLSGTNTTLDVKGNFTNNQNIIAGNSSNVIFSGNGVQNITHTPTGITQIVRSNNTSVNIPDNTPLASTDNTIPVASELTGCATCAYREVTMPAGSYTGIHSLNFSIAHPRVDNLDIYLLTPNNTVLLISTDNGGNNANYTNTTISDAATTNISAGTAPFTDSYRPEIGNLSDYTGPMAGNWRLYVIDDQNNNTT